MWHKVAKTPKRCPGRTLFVVAEEALQSPVVVTPKSSQVTRDTDFLPKNVGRFFAADILWSWYHHDIIMISSWYFDNLFVCCNWSNRMAWILANLEQAMYQFSRKACLGQCPGWTLGTGWHSILQVCPVLQSRRSRCFANQPKTIIMEICMSWILVSPKLQPKCQAPSPNLTALPWQHQTPFNAAKAWNFRRGTLSFCPPFFFF